MFVAKKPALTSVPAQPASSIHEVQPEHEGFRAERIQRLAIAIINHAVLDLLENGSHSAGAERWLLSREFDQIHKLLG